MYWNCMFALNIAPNDKCVLNWILRWKHKCKKYSPSKARAANECNQCDRWLCILSVLFLANDGHLAQCQAPACSHGATCVPLPTLLWCLPWKIPSITYLAMEDAGGMAISRWKLVGRTWWPSSEWSNCAWPAPHVCASCCLQCNGSALNCLTLVRPQQLKCGPVWLPGIALLRNNNVRVRINRHSVSSGGGGVVPPPDSSEQPSSLSQVWTHIRCWEHWTPFPNLCSEDCH